jgi:tol-pal system protein YbgF
MPVLLTLLLALIFALPAHAQDANEQRLQRLERDLQMMQGVVYRGKAPGTGGAPTQAQASVAAMQQDEAYRQLNGQIEQLQHQIRQLTAQLKRLEEDADFRLQELEAAQQKLTSQMQQQQQAIAQAMPAPAAEGIPPSSLPTNGQTTPVQPITEAGGNATPQPTPAATEANPAALQPPIKNGQFTSARAHYNYAFTLLNQGKFADARTALQSFIQSYPKDPLVGNAHYWVGETYYADRNFAEAAVQFRKGYEANTKGPKAPDNLYKLGTSLASLGKTQEACVVIAGAQANHPNASKELAKKIEAEKTRLKCE